MSYKPRSICLKFIPALVFLLFFQVVRSQSFSALDELIEQQKSQFGGKLAVMVWKDSLLYQKQTGEDFTVNTQLPAGCASAWFTAALVMTFVEQGKITLDDPVSDYLPIYSQYAKSYLTIRHCLANTTGLAGEKGGIERFFQKTKFTSLEDQVNAFASTREIVTNPGEAFSYNNIGTNIAGRVLEVVGRKPFDRLMQERIFRPLGMKKSSFASETAVNPFSGAVSTAADMNRFLSMLLNGGTLGTKKVLSPESIEEMNKIQTGEAKTVFVPAHTQGFGYGLGNWIHDPGQGNFRHSSPGLSGGWPYIDVQKKLAIVIFGQPGKNKDDNKEVYLRMINAAEAVL